MNLTTARYVVAAGIALVAVAIVALVLVVILRGGVTTSAISIGGLVSFVGTLIGLLVNLLATQAVATTAGKIEKQVNGHLAAHDRLAAGQNGSPPSPPPAA